MSSPRLNRLLHQKVDRRPSSPLTKENEARVQASQPQGSRNGNLGDGTSNLSDFGSIGDDGFADSRKVWLIHILLREQGYADHGRRGMLIRVHVTPNAKEARVLKVGDGSFEVRVDERAVNGRANKRLLEILSKHFVVPKSRIFITKGMRSRDKIVQVNLESAEDEHFGNP